MRYQTYGFTISALTHMIGIFFIMTFCKFLPVETKPLLIDLTTFTIKKTVPQVAKAILPIQQATPHVLPAKPVIKENPPVATLQPLKRKITPTIKKAETPAKVIETVSTPAEQPPPTKTVIEDDLAPEPPPARVTEEKENIPTEIVRSSSISQNALVDHRGESDSFRRQDYIKAHFLYIKDEIQKNISYPPLARKMGWEGKVVVSFVVCENGMVVNIKIVKSSGIALLDKSAIETIKKTVPFPSPPAKAEMVIPITYTLG